MAGKSDFRRFPHELVESIYGNLTREKPWDDALELLRLSLNSNVACLRISLKGPPRREYLYAAGPRAGKQATDEWEARAPHEMLPVDLQPDVPRLIDWSEIQARGSALDLSSRCDVPMSELRSRYDVRFSAVSLIDSDDMADYILYVSRGDSSKCFGADDLTFLQLAGRHFGRAMKLRQELVKAQVINEFQADTLDRLGIAAVLVRSNRHFTALNNAARRMFTESEGLRICGGQLHTVDERDDRVFQSILKESLESQGIERSRAMLIKCGGKGRDLNLLVSARRSASLFSDRIETCALVFVRRASLADDADLEVLQQLFSFTKAEARLALGLARGKRLEDVELELNIRHNTARAHLRSMFVKADVNRQSELIHLLANSLVPLGRHFENSSMAQSPKNGTMIQ